MNDLKQSSKKSIVGEKTASKLDPLTVSRSNSLRVHRIAKGSNYEPSIITGQQKDKLVEIESEN